MVTFKRQKEKVDTHAQIRAPARLSALQTHDNQMNQQMKPYNSRLDCWLNIDLSIASNTAFTSISYNIRIWWFCFLTHALCAYSTFFLAHMDRLHKRYSTKSIEILTNVSPETISAMLVGCAGSGGIFAKFFTSLTGTSARDNPADLNRTNSFLRSLNLQ